MSYDSIHIAIRNDPPHGDSAACINVELSSCSQCSSCQSLLYDEQIMSGWSGDEANYKTTCPYCSSQLVASLTITTRQVCIGGRGGCGTRVSLIMKL